MNTISNWEAYLRSHFPGFLLPKTEHHSVSETTAKNFLECIGLHGRDLTAFRAMSLLAGHSDALHDFACYWLPELVRVLPSRAAVDQRVWRGGYQGRLDTRATLALHLAGARDTFVTRTRHREFNLPENVFVRSLAGRTLSVLEEMQRLGLLHGDDWTGGAVRSLASLRLLLQSTALREIDETAVKAHQLHAATHARHPGYRSALTWFELMSDALESTDSERLANVLRDGALRPLSESKRFEVAVLLTLLESIESRLAAHEGWTVSRHLIAASRREVATFERGASSVSVFYDQAVLPFGDELGPRDRGVARYLGTTGRMRPDITVRTRHADGTTSYVVFEIKLTDDLSYAASGFGEALLYRQEYAGYLCGWPKAVLVTSCPIEAVPRREDDVVAVNWAQLAESAIVDGVLEGALAPTLHPWTSCSEI